MLSLITELLFWKVGNLGPKIVPVALQTSDIIDMQSMKKITAVQ